MLTTTCLSSQNLSRTNTWYFGRNAGIDFNVTPPSPLSDGALNNWEGCATICDTFGKIMIYTDGQKIWNKNHDIIPGAINLGGSNSATQSGLIVPFPNSAELLYVFSVDDQGKSGGLRYAVVDMTLNGGLGGLVSSNNVLLNQCTEKITAIPHCNKHDYWLIAHEYGNNNFVVWEISNSGISSSKTISIRTTHPSTASGAIGYMKSSPSGSQIALGVDAGNFFELFDFNNETGEISNPIKFTNTKFDNPYGVEFSPDGTRLYIAGVQNSPILFQANLDLPTAQEIINSVIIIAEGSSSYFGAIQNAPNGKIYIAKDNSDYLSVIHNPNELGASCNFIEDDFYLGGKESALGLPNLIPSYFYPEQTIQLISTLKNCDGTADINVIADIVGDSIIYQWYFNNILIPNQTTTQIQVNSTGLYKFEAHVSSDCQGSDIVYSKQIFVSIPDQLEITDIQLTHLCSIDSGSISIVGSGGTMPYQYSIDGGVTFQLSSQIVNLASGIYEIVLKDSNGCTTSELVELKSTNTPVIDNVQIVHTSCGKGNGNLEILASNGTGQLIYSIDEMNFQQENSFNNLNSGTYIITVIDSLGCSVMTIEEIGPSVSPYISSISSTPATCGQDNGTIEISAASGVPPYKYSIDGVNFQTSQSFTSLTEGVYTIIISDNVGCIDSISLEMKSEEYPSIINVDITNAYCNKDNGSILVNVIGGIDTKYSIDGFAFQESNYFKNLAAGNYTILVKDIYGCQDTTTIKIEESELPMLESVEIIHTSCGEVNGMIKIEASGSNLSFSINGLDFQQENFFQHLAPGDYTISIKDGNGCVFTNEVEIKSSSEMSIELIESTPADCGESNGGLTFNVLGGTGVSLVSINGGTFQSSFSIDGLSSGEYDIKVIDEAECLTDTTVVILQEGCPIYIPNVFSPNNDGLNDILRIYPHPEFIGDFKLFRIFDRWGECVFEATNFSPDEIGWDGTHKGKEMENGVYVYYLLFVSVGGNSAILEGDITIAK